MELSVVVSFAAAISQAQTVDFLSFRQLDCVWRPGIFMQTEGSISLESSFPPGKNTSSLPHQAVRQGHL